MRVIADIDEILRENKQPLPEDVREGLRKFQGKGGELTCITGAPLGHVPKPLFSIAKVIFAEMGGVSLKEGEMTLFKAEEIEHLRSLLGITASDGFQEIEEGNVIIEGPRQASLTLLFGKPPHYPIQSTADFGRAKERIELLIKEHRLSVHLTPGKGSQHEYQWLDITVTTKAETVKRLLAQDDPGGPIFYLGDGGSDFEAMKILEVIPVGFTNCLPEIQELAQSRGVFIPLPAPHGGTVAFFSSLLKGEV